MKRIEILVPPAQFEQAKDALLGIGVDSMTLAEVKHLDPGTRRREVFRGSAYVVDYVLRVKMDLVVHDPIVPRILQELARVLDDGGSDMTKVVVSEVVDVVRIPSSGRREGARRSGPLLRSA
jgi:nitrogen regulatory protein P-II 1